MVEMDKVNRSKRNIEILLLFCCLSFFFTFWVARTQLLSGFTSDGSFHFSRAEEIYQNLRSGHLFTFIATHTFHNSGVGSFLFYPTVFLYPWALLRFVFDPIMAFYIWYGLFMFLTLSCAYYAMYGFSRDRLRAVMFALFYTISSYHVYLGLRSYVLGEFIAYTFIPLAMYGFYEVIWGDQRKWPLLAGGVALLTYSHMISVVITVGFFICLFLCRLIVDRHFSKERWVTLLKSVAVTFLLVAWFLYPFWTDFIKTRLGTPSFGFAFLYSMQDLWQASLENYATNRGLGIVLLATALGGWYFVRHDKRELSLYILGLIFIVLSTNLFPYTEIARIKFLKILGVIQFPYRFTTYSSFFMAAILSLILARIFRRFQGKAKVLVGLFVLSIAMCLYVQTLTPVLERLYNVSTTTRLKKATDKFAIPSEEAVIDKRNYYDLYTYRVPYGETDYYPKVAFDGNMIETNPKTQSILLHQAYIDHKTVVVYPRPQTNALEYQIKLKNVATVDLPVVAYPSEKVSVNGQTSAYTVSERGTIQVNLERGVNNVTVYFEMKKTYYVLFGLAMLTWFVLLVTPFIKLKKALHDSN